MNYDDGIVMTFLLLRTIKNKSTVDPDNFRDLVFCNENFQVKLL